MIDIEEFHDRIAEGATTIVQSCLVEDPTLIQVRNQFNNTPLHTACWHKHPEIIELLLTLGADINAIGFHGFTPLHYAVWDGDTFCIPIVATLLENGADPEITDGGGRKPSELAESELFEDREQVIALLRAKQS